MVQIEQKCTVTWWLQIFLIGDKVSHLLRCWYQQAEVGNSYFDKLKAINLSKQIFLR